MASRSAKLIAKDTVLPNSCTLKRSEANQGDGEGCARLVMLRGQEFVAGESTEFFVEFTVGPSGISTGGGIALGIHHAAEWITTLHEKKPGFVQVRSERAGALRVERRNGPPQGMFTDPRQAMNSNQIFHYLFIARVDDRALEPGERVQFHFGANEHGVRVQPQIDRDHQFRLTTDVDGDGVFEAIATSPIFEIKPAPAATLTAVIPSQVVVGVPAQLQVRAEDAYLNVATDYDGEIEVRDEQGRIVLAGLKLQRGIGEATVNLNHPGPHRLRLHSASGTLEGRSNPLRVFETEPARKIFWADLHGHTGVSDGLGKDAEEYFRFGRDIARLDINALTDHGHFDWPANVDAVQRFHEPGRYVTLLAQEAGVGPDHMNVYYRYDNMPHIRRWHSDYVSQLEEVRQQFNTEEVSAITAPHHFAYDRGDAGDPRYPFEVWDGRITRFVEVYSSHGTSEFPGNPRPLHKTSTDRRKYMQAALEQGLKFGVIAASDNHDSHPGRSSWAYYPGGLAGVWASELSREAVWQALYNYRTYGTSLDRIYLDFSINGKPMGSTLSTSAEIAIEAEIIGKTDILTATLLRDNQPIVVQKSKDGVIQIQHLEEPSGEGHVYYLRVEQINGERAWSSPIWIEPDV